MLAACGGDEPAAGTPATTPDPGAQPAQATTGGSQAQGGEQAEQTTVLEREVFTYQGAGRDPFLSLMRSGDVRPLLEDLRVTSINFDVQYPMNSVAVVRDVSVGLRYPVRVGDVLGRLRVAAIRPQEVVLAYEEFGQQHQDTLRLTRQGGSQ